MRTASSRGAGRAGGRTPACLSKARRRGEANVLQICVVGLLLKRFGSSDLTRPETVSACSRPSLRVVGRDPAAGVKGAAGADM